MAVDFFEEKQEEKSFGASNNIQGPTGMSGWLIKKGWAQNKEQANYILIIILAIVIIITLVVVFTQNKPKYLTPDQIKQIQNYRITE